MNNYYHFLICIGVLSTVGAQIAYDLALPISHCYPCGEHIGWTSTRRSGSRDSTSRYTLLLRSSRIPVYARVLKLESAAVKPIWPVNCGFVGRAQHCSMQELCISNHPVANGWLDVETWLEKGLGRGPRHWVSALKAY